jgi:hypothetical protein
VALAWLDAPVAEQPMLVDFDVATAVPAFMQAPGVPGELEEEARGQWAARERIEPFELGRHDFPYSFFLLCGKSDLLHGNVPHGPIIEPFRPLVRELLRAPPEVSASLRDRIRKGIAPNGHALTDEIPDPPPSPCSCRPSPSWRFDAAVVLPHRHTQPLASGCLLLRGKRPLLSS